MNRTCAFVGITCWAFALTACNGSGLRGDRTPDFSALPSAVSANLGKVALRVHSPNAPVVDVYGQNGQTRNAVEAALSDFDINKPEHVFAPFVALSGCGSSKSETKRYKCGLRPLVHLEHPTDYLKRAVRHRWA